MMIFPSEVQKEALLFSDLQLFKENNIYETTERKETKPSALFLHNVYVKEK